MTILAVSSSWTKWATFAISLMGMVWIHLLCIYGQNKTSIYIATAIAGTTSLVPLGIGIYTVTSYWWEYCGVFLDNPWYYVPCRISGFISILCGLLWLVVAFCLIRFVKSGRHAEWEEERMNSKNPAADDDETHQVAVESAFVEASQVDVVAVEEGTILASSSTTVTSEMISDGAMVPIKIN